MLGLSHAEWERVKYLQREYNRRKSTMITNLEKSLEPPVNKWEEYTKPEYIEELIFYMAEDFAKKGVRTEYKAAYDALYMHIHENIEKYYPEEDENEET